MSAEIKRGRGRPPVAPEDRREVRVELKVTEAEHGAWSTAAGDRALGAWLRDLANVAASKGPKRR